MWDPGLWKVMAGVLVVCSDFFASIYWFDWSKKYFKLFIQYLFCWLPTCVYFIYYISVHWSWNLSLGTLENFQWAVYKPGIQICFPHRFVEGRGKGTDFCYFNFPHQYIDWHQVKHPRFFRLIGVCISFSSWRISTWSTIQNIYL